MENDPVKRNPDDQSEIDSPRERIKARAQEAIEQKRDQGSTSPEIDAFFDHARVLWFEEGAEERDPELRQVTHLLSDSKNQSIEKSILQQRERVRKDWEEKLNPNKTRADNIIQEYTEKGSDHPALDAFLGTMTSVAEDIEAGGDILERDPGLAQVTVHLHTAMSAEMLALTGQKQAEALNILEGKLGKLKEAFSTQPTHDTP